MTVYVDDMLRKAKVGPVDGRWSHLFADDRDELHAFAHRLGLRIEWFQDHPTRWHYDVIESVRREAIRLGAKPMLYPAEVGRFFAARAKPPQRSPRTSPPSTPPSPA